jgi:hypothetical protein
MKDQFFADYLQRLEGLQHWLNKDVPNLPAERWTGRRGRK